MGLQQTRARRRSGLIRRECRRQPGRNGAGVSAASTRRQPAAAAPRSAPRAMLGYGAPQRGGWWCRARVWPAAAGCARRGQPRVPAKQWRQLARGLARAWARRPERPVGLRPAPAMLAARIAANNSRVGDCVWRAGGRLWRAGQRQHTVAESAPRLTRRAALLRPARCGVQARKVAEIGRRKGVAVKVLGRTSSGPPRSRSERRSCPACHPDGMSDASLLSGIVYDRYHACTPRNKITLCRLNPTAQALAQATSSPRPRPARLRGSAGGRA